MTTLSDNDKRKYLRILEELKQNHANIFTLSELSDHLGVSKRKLIDFRAGRIVDLPLLFQYAGIIGRKIEITLL